VRSARERDRRVLAGFGLVDERISSQPAREPLCHQRLAILVERGKRSQRVSRGRRQASA
jgi:hypothetical protein